METFQTRPHILLGGEKKAGKSTLIRRLLGICACPVYGFITKKDPPGANGLCGIYMYPASVPEEKRKRTEENRIGFSSGAGYEICKDVFASLGVALIEQAEPGGLLVMDELGFMEAEVPAFTDAVLRALQADIPVLAAVKQRYDVAFLNTVRNTERARLYTVNADTRDVLFETLSGEYPFCRK